MEPGILAGSIASILLAVPFRNQTESASSVYTVPAKACTSVMPLENGNQSEANEELKDRVRAFWETHPCGTKFTDTEMGTREFFERIEAHRYGKEWHIPIAANFAATRGLRVLEIGCGMGTDGAQFAKAGADYTGIDLTDAAVELARKHFELLGLRRDFRTADAEKLDFSGEAVHTV